MLRKMHSHHIAWTLLVVILTCHAKDSNDPIGHMKPLGSHRRFSGGIAMIGKFPAPWTFYQNFVKESQPLMMRGVLQEGGIPAYHKWSDEYLREKYGDLSIEVEEGKKEDRANGRLSQMTFREYLDTYESEQRYLVSDVQRAMKGDVHVPLTLQCGGFQDKLAKVVMWFSSGGTKSHLHNDGLDNINCLLDGQKEIFMVDRKYKDRIQADGWVVDGGYSSVDVDAVDMYKFPKLRKVPWYSVTIHQGDCLYIPYGWYHQVNSASGRNFALNFWFTHLIWYNETDCEHVDAHETQPISLKKFKMVSSDIEDQEAMRFHMFEKFERGGYETVSREDFLSRIDDRSDETEKELNECFDFIDKDKDGTLSWKEMQLFDLKHLHKKYEKLLEEIVNSATNFEEQEREENTDKDSDVPPESDNEIAAEDVKEEVLLEDNQSNKDVPSKKDVVHEEL